MTRHVSPRGLGLLALRRLRRSIRKGPICEAISSCHARAAGPVGDGGVCAARRGRRGRGLIGNRHRRQGQLPRLSGAALPEPRVAVRRRLRQPRRASTSATTSRRSSSSPHVPGSGNDMTYTVTLPTEPNASAHASRVPARPGTSSCGPTFWFGLTLCDTESAPEFTKTCTPDSDANDLVGTNPEAPDYIGKHPGNAYMELQFYGPGYVPQFEGFGCTAHQYCAAMTIDSRTLDQNTGVREHRRLRQLRPRRPRADQLGLHHQERAVPGAGQPAVHRHLRRPELQRGEPGHDQGPADEPGRPDPHPHARHAGRVPDRPRRPDDAARAAR